ncbi:MAG TPA: histidine kinase [Phenylobacterium sp.]
MAVFLITAFRLGPAGAPETDRLVSAVLFANLAWALGLLILSRRRVMTYGVQRLQAVLPGVDLAIFTTVLYLTSGADSPFFSPFVMLILGTTIQWGSRGATLMGVLTLIVFLPAGWQVFFGVDHGPQAAMSFVLRVGYTAIISVMLMAFGRHVERVVDELARLSDPLTQRETEAGPPVSACLRHALQVFRAQRGAFIWEEGEEPYANLELLQHGRWERRRLLGGDESWIAPEVAEAVFLFHRASATSVVREGRSALSGPSDAIAASLLAQVPFERALILPASTRNLRGWALILDYDEQANEDLAVGAMVSAQISVALERWDSETTRRANLATEDRIRLARDLHDGVLQFLAGTRLHLDSISQTPHLPDDAQARISALREAITDEQRELRGFIATLRPPRTGLIPHSVPLAAELTELAARLSRYWKVTVTADVRPDDAVTPHRVSYDLGRIVREAVANAVRHGGARTVHVAATLDGGQLSVRIDDNGRGFAREGEVTTEPLDQSAMPWSLRERVRALEGRLELRSSAKGATILINLPLEAA